MPYPQSASSPNIKLLPPINQDNNAPDERIFDQNTIVIHEPQLKALVTIVEGMNPHALDATNSQPISLRDSLKASLDQNLDIGISASNQKMQGWNYFGSLGKFLPDIVNNYNWQYLRGRVNVPFGTVPTLLRLHNPLIITSTGFRLWGYQGGKVMFGALQSKHNYKAAQAQRKSTISDVLLDTTRQYYNLILNEALLEIRVQAVGTSQAQYQQNKDLHEDGLATQLDVLQFKTQLSKDRQNLIDQQVARRNASIQLAHILNANMAVDLIPDNRLVRKVRLVSDRLQIGDLLNLAIVNRPELKQFEELRLAAKRAIIVSSAPLQPQFQFFGKIYGIGETLGRDTTMTPPFFQPVALAGQPLTSPVAGIAGAMFGDTIAPSAGPVYPVGGAYSPPHSVSTQVAALYTLGFRVDWNFNSLGVPDIANIQAAKQNARQAQLRATKELLDVIEQVRSSYLSGLSAEKKIDEATDEVASSHEALRLAQLRFQNGLGTNIDIIQAQRDYTQALIDKAQAIINFNIAQAQLLHDIGLASIDNLTSERPLLR